MAEILTDDAGQQWLRASDGTLVPYQGNDLRQSPIQSLRDLIRPEPGWEYGNVLPLRSNAEGKIELTVPMLARDFAHGWLDLMEGPARAGAYMRNPAVSPTDVVTPNALMSMAGTGIGGGRLMTQPGESSLGMFVGPQAKGEAAEQIEAARKFITSGWHVPNAVRAKLGMDSIEEAARKRFGASGQFADKNFRYEIDDSGARLKTIAEDSWHWPQGRPPADATIASVQAGLLPYGSGYGMPMQLGRILEHPKLFDAYPGLAKIPVYVDDTLGAGAYYDPPRQAIHVGREVSLGKPEELRDVLLHEIQHAIQHKEMFARGGSPEEFLTENYKQRRKAISNAAGEWVMKMNGDPYVQGILREYKVPLRGTDIYTSIVTQKDPFEKLLPEARAEMLERLRKSETWHKLEAIGNKGAELQAEYKAGPYRQYRSLAGESEANLTQSRANLTAEQRRAQPFEYEYPLSEQIVKEHLKIPSWTTAPDGTPVQIVPVDYNPFKKTGNRK